VKNKIKIKNNQLVTHYGINPAHSFLGKNILSMMIREMKKKRRLKGGQQ